MARQELKDRFGHKIGEIRDEGNRQMIYDRFDHKKRSFDETYTYDAFRHRVGSGNLLSTLLL